MIAVFGREPLRSDEIFEEISALAERLRPFVCETSQFFSDAKKENKKILLEGAQATLLDVDHGTYPFVTSSNPTAGGASVGSGIPPHHISGVLGIVRTYATRVGEGPFPTEMLEDEEEMANLIREREVTNSAPLPNGRGAAVGSTRLRPVTPPSSMGLIQLH